MKIISIKCLGRTNTVMCLLADGADVETADDDGNSALNIAVAKGI